MYICIFAKENVSVSVCLVFVTKKVCARACWWTVTGSHVESCWAPTDISHSAVTVKLKNLKGTTTKTPCLTIFQCKQ